MELQLSHSPEVEVPGLWSASAGGGPTLTLGVGGSGGVAVVGGGMHSVGSALGDGQTNLAVSLVTPGGREARFAGCGANI